jgi:predicted dehydrogenase
MWSNTPSFDHRGQARGGQRQGAGYDGFMNTKPLRLGILGCAKIAHQFARDVQSCPDVQLVAVASRDLHKAKAFAHEHHMARAHGSYQALLDDDHVQAVYIPLPNSMHAHWAIEAARAGKHILCEKPLCLGVAEALAMFEQAHQSGVMLVEAYPYYFQPQTRDLLDLLQQGRIGHLQSIQATFGFPVQGGDSNIRMQAALGGGALLDAGSYPMSLIRLVMGEAPESVSAQSVWSHTDVDMATWATLQFSGHRVAQLSCAMNTANHRHATLVGDAGAIETEFLNHTALTPHSDARGYQPSLLRVREGTANTVPLQTLRSHVGSGFAFAAEAFARVVREQDWAGVHRAAQASVDIAASLEAIAKSARSGRKEAVTRIRLKV